MADHNLLLACVLAAIASGEVVQEEDDLRVLLAWLTTQHGHHRDRVSPTLY